MNLPRHRPSSNTSNNQQGWVAGLVKWVTTVLHFFGRLLRWVRWVGTQIFGFFGRLLGWVEWVVTRIFGFLSDYSHPLSLIFELWVIFKRYYLAITTTKGEDIHVIGFWEEGFCIGFALFAAYHDYHHHLIYYQLRQAWAALGPMSPYHPGGMFKWAMIGFTCAKAPLLFFPHPWWFVVLGLDLCTVIFLAAGWTAAQLHAIAVTRDGADRSGLVLLFKGFLFLLVAGCMGFLVYVFAVVFGSK